MHVALAHQSVVHGEGSCQAVACLSHLGNLQIVAQQRTVVRMSTVLYDEVCTLYWALASQVGHTLLCNDDVYIVLRVILMAYHGTIELIRPPLAVDGQVKMLMYALRSKSPLPPIPFIIFVPLMCVELALP